MSDAPPLATITMATAPTIAVPTLAAVGARNPSSRRLNFESDGSAANKSTTSAPSTTNWRRISTSNSMGLTAGTRPVRSPATNAATNRNATKPANSQVQTPLKLSFGQRVGQSREVAEVESFTAKLRREIAERERPANLFPIQVECE
jgi:hypothetical protein